MSNDTPFSFSALKSIANITLGDYKLNVKLMVEEARMANVTITINDTTDGSVDVKAEFDPVPQRDEVPSSAQLIGKYCTALAKMLAAMQYNRHTQETIMSILDPWIDKQD